METGCSPQPPFAQEPGNLPGLPARLLLELPFAFWGDMGLAAEPSLEEDMLALK